MEHKRMVLEAGESLAGDNDPLIGTAWDDRYDIISVLGKGASGTVYKARHLNLDKYVALKVIKVELLGSATSLQRFQNEAALLGSFDQANIVKFLSFGCTPAGRHYMVQEYLDGKTLAHLLSVDRALFQQRAVPLFLDLCRALAYAHGKGVIHRDLKPGNIMIVNCSGSECAKLLDFGIFKTVAAEQNLTSTGQLLGSANYMSPEQCRADKLDFRSDIYSMGCLIYETLAGEAPMQAENELLIMAHQLNKSIKSVPAIHGISPELESIVLKCLEKNPEERFASANELFSAIEQAQSKPLVKTGGLRKRSILAACLLCGIALVSFSVSLAPRNGKAADLAVSKSAKEIERLRKTRRPEVVNNNQELSKLENWIEANVTVRDFDAIQLAKGFCQANSFRERKGIKGQVPDGVMIESLLAQALSREKKLFGIKTRDYASLLDNLARLQTLNGKHKEAVETLKLLLKSHPESEPVDERQRKIDIYDCLARNESDCKNYASALLFLKSRGSLMNDPADRVRLLRNLIREAKTCLLMNDEVQARSCARQAAHVFKPDEISSHKLDPRDAAPLSYLLKETGQYSLLISLFKKCQLQLGNSAGFNQEIADLNFDLAYSCYKSGAHTEAEKQAKNLQSYMRQSPDQKGTKVSAATEQLLGELRKDKQP